MIMGAIVLVVVAVLVVNYFRNLPTGSTSKTGVKTESVKHTVAAGETLWSIAENYYGDGFSWQELADANNITSPESLEVGQELSIPNKEVEVATTETVKTESAISGTTYTVVKGDSLWEIAVRAYGDGYQWVKIARENNLVNPDTIHTGNNLIIPR
jgi:nucleoid-associated protein YgaU